MGTDLTIRQRTVRALVSGPSASVLRRRGGEVALGVHVSAGRAHGRAGADAHVLHAGSHALHLQVAELLLEELDIPSSLAHLAVETRPDSIVVGLLSHSIGAIE